MNITPPTKNVKQKKVIHANIRAGAFIVAIWNIPKRKLS
jgi:hypothetical protein